MFKRKTKQENEAIKFDKTAKKRKSKKRTGAIVLVIAVVVALFGATVGVISDWLWFKDLGYTAVFWKKFLTMLKIGTPMLIVVSLLMRFYLRTLKEGYYKKIESHETSDAKNLNKISWVLSVLFGLIVSVIATSSTWFDALKYLNSTSFDLKDPLFNIDISFYIFKLEYLTQINDIALIAVVGMVVVTLVYYSILLSVRTPDVFERESDDPYGNPKGEGFRETQDDYEEQEEAQEASNSQEANPFAGTPFEKMFNGKQFSAQNKARQHKPKRTFDFNSSNLDKLLAIASGKLTLLGVIFYIMLGVDFFLKQFNLLHSHTGTVYGAGYTDVHFTLWVYRAIMVLAVVGVITIGMHIKKGELKKLLRVPVVMAAVLVLGAVGSIAVQSLLVSPDEINKETKYLENNIEYTRHAYGLDNIKLEEYAADNSLTSEVLDENSQTLSNIRINDYEPVQQFYNQTQSIRQYYHFNDVDIDRYNGEDGKYQTYLSPREIDEEKVSDTWLNMHLKYTHGYGSVVSQVKDVTTSGQPDVIVGNIPPESAIDAIQITRPEIYFGELTNEYVIVNTKEKEFDYPDGSSNQYTTYEGKNGIKLNFFTRLLYAVKEGDIQILVSGNITSDSKIIYNRNVIDRVKTIMPYLSYEDDPYLTVVDGKQYWIVDAYTTSSYYPYSEPYSEKEGTTNYIRNSIKVVVDAYEGTVDFYVVDEEDPIALTYQKIYPSLFKSYDKMPEGIKEHIRYPNSLFKIQAGVYGKYHMTDTKVFYQKEDLWDIAHQIYGTKEVEMEPSYYTFKLPDSDSAEFINMVPFTPKSKMNMTALMMARNDGDHYGEIVVYTMPKSKTVYGPMQIEAQIDQNTEISKEFSLWDSSGSTYSRGDLFVIPIGTSFLYVEPVYLEASNSAIPEVKRVIVAYGDQIAYKPTLSEALESIFGGSYGDSGMTDTSSSSSSSGGTSTSELISKAQEAYDNAQSAIKSGDWTKYGEYMNQLEGYLNQLA